MRKKNEKTISYAQTYWRDFENLVLEYIKDYYKIDNEYMAKLTPPSKDGGYDGVIYWVINPFIKDINEILFEAKLRSSLGNALPMNDFSKVLVIAVNRFSDVVYIATNTTFSADTKRQLELYEKRTGIAIKTLNGKKLYEWYCNYPLQTNLEFKKEFVDFLKESAAKILDISSETLSMPSKVSSSIMYIKDTERIKSINILTELILKEKKGGILIRGKRGYGKSMLCAELKEVLDDTGYLMAEINLKHSDTSREIFLGLLYTIWGVTPEAIAGSSEKELMLIFSQIGDEKLNDENLKCIKTIFSKKVQEYTGHYDIYQSYLIEIIDKLFSRYTERKYYCIHIHNLDAGYYESCLFIMKLLSKLKNYNILFLIEVRDDYNGDGIITLDEWKAICKRLSNMECVFNEYIINKLSSKEKNEYILNKIPGLNENQLLQLENCLPDNPLVLNSALNIFSQSISKKYLLESEFKNELEFFKRNYENEIIRQEIRNKIRFGGFEHLAIAFAIISILNGRCNISQIQKIIKCDKMQLSEDLNNTGFFYIEDDCIQVKHELYLNCLHNYYDYLSVSLLYDIAKKMLNEIDVFYTDALQKGILRLKLLKILGKAEDMLVLSCEIGKTLLKQGDLKQALHIYEIGYTVFSKLTHDKIDNIFLKLEVLKRMLYVYENTVGDNSSEAQLLLLELESLIKSVRHKIKNSDLYVDAYLNVLILKMKNLHRKEQHSECLKYSYMAKRYAVKKGIYKKFPETMEQILWLKSLSIKHLYGIYACLQSFECDIKKYPELPVLMYSFNTHKTFLISTKNPSYAMKYFKANEKYYISLSMSNQLHNRVNVANMHFFLHEYDMSIYLANNIANDALVYDVQVELGRIYNLIGNYYFIFNDLDKGLLFYDKAIQIFEKIENQIHIWPPLINAASLYLEMKDYESAYKILIRITKILKLKKDELRNNRATDANGGLKLYIGMIIVLHHLYEISTQIENASFLYKEFINSIAQYMPHQISKIIYSKTEYNNFFNDSVYMHMCKIILKV